MNDRITMPDTIAVVVIARNEGERLKRCLRSIPPQFRAVYVDSGSTDGSIEFARSLGVTTIELDTSAGFTAARARNAGWRALAEMTPPPQLIQFVDGDCELAPGWLATGRAALEADDSYAAVFGRRRERHPERSLYNRMCDDEWNVPIGDVDACGGDVLFRLTALQQAGGYSNDLIAGEEPDLCLRLSRFGWKIRRIEGEMTLHDANILDLRSWWRRSRRAGYAYTEHVWRHGSNSIPGWRRQLKSIVIWGIALPCIALSVALALLPRTGLSLTVLALLLLLLAMQIVRIARSKRVTTTDGAFALRYAMLTMLGKFAEAGGALRCWMNHVRNSPSRLIEYKKTI